MKRKGTTVIEVLVVILVLLICFVSAVYTVTYRRMAREKLKELIKNPVTIQHKEFKNG